MLSGIKAGNKKISLMHYLTALVASKEPQLLDFAVDLKGVSHQRACYRFKRCVASAHEHF